MLRLSINIMLELIDERYRFSNNKIVIVLKAIIIFIKKIIEKLKLRTILDEIRKLVSDSKNRDININKKII